MLIKDKITVSNLAFFQVFRVTVIRVNMMAFASNWKAQTLCANASVGLEGLCAKLPFEMIKNVIKMIQFAILLSVFTQSAWL